MMKSIAFNESTNTADEEGFVIIDAPMELDSSVMEEEDEESYDHCDDAFSFSSLHQTLPLSSLPMETVRDNFFERPVGQEVVPPVDLCSHSLLSDCEDDDGKDEDSPSSPSGNSSTMKVVIPHIDSDVEGLCALVSSIPSIPPSGGIVSQRDEQSTEDSKESIPCVVSTIKDNAEDNDAYIDPSPELMTAPGEEKEVEAGTSAPSSSSSSSGVGTSTDEGEDDDVGSLGPDKAFDSLEAHPVGRVSKKKLRKQMKLAKKASVAASALGQMSMPPKRRGKNRKKVANIAVSCAVQSIAEYKEHVERTKLTKKIH